MRKCIVLVGLLLLKITTYAEASQLSTEKSVSHNSCTEKEIPLTQPNQSDIAVLAFANRAILSAFSYDYINYNKALKSSSKFFTKKGYEEFSKALKVSDNLNQLIHKKLSVSSIPMRAPLILHKGELNGLYAWKIQMPIKVKYQKSTDLLRTQEVAVTVLIVRDSSKRDSNGIGISQLIAAPYSRF